MDHLINKLAVGVVEEVEKTLRLSGKRISDIYINITDTNHQNFFSVQDLIRENRIVEILPINQQNNNFECRIDIDTYLEFVQTNLCHSQNRFNRQIDGLSQMGFNERFAPGWILVTAYYAAYFSALEILRLNNVLVNYFTADFLDEFVLRNMNVINFSPQLQGGNYTGRVQFLNPRQQSPYVRILYTRQGQGNHELLWDELFSTIQTLVNKHGEFEKSEDWKAKVLYGSFIKIFNNQNSTPNSIRNFVNYYDPQVFWDKNSSFENRYRKFDISKDEQIFSQIQAQKHQIHSTTQLEPFSVETVLFFNKRLLEKILTSFCLKIAL